MNRTSLVAQMVKNLPTVQETWVRSLSQENLLEMEWHSTPVFLPGECHGQRFLVGYNPWGRKEPDMTKHLTHTHHVNSVRDSGGSSNISYLFFVH